ncbi:uncharacterized protein DUF3159 [Actinophytocola oryzae]|uniref:Uncharacterized protein DUF3159 n=1 Tax=Actinophytocola oryzae TaxID=502181 RepID=A0A4R7UP33_9PSEU|nr:uncharacterized protein DUF3159 [Actinophytocola oryzae]
MYSTSAPSGGIRIKGALLTQRSSSLFASLGGWRTVAEMFVSRVLFLISYLLTRDVLVSALVAVGGVIVFAVFRIWADRKYWQATAGLIMVGISAALAGATGEGVNFYLQDIVRNVGAAAVLLVSMLVSWPVIGLLIGFARGEGVSWRHDQDKRRRYQLCTAVFMAKFVVAPLVMLPFYLAGDVVALGIVATLMGTPAIAICVYCCWRILRTPAPDADPAPKPA